MCRATTATAGTPSVALSPTVSLSRPGGPKPIKVAARERGGNPRSLSALSGDELSRAGRMEALREASEILLADLLADV